MRNTIIDGLAFLALVIVATAWVAGVSTSQGQSIDRAHAVLRSR
jgi:hypothetical protein